MGAARAPRSPTAKPEKRKAKQAPGGGREHRGPGEPCFLAGVAGDAVLDGELFMGRGNVSRS
jgi:hypothetical protein